MDHRIKQGPAVSEAGGLHWSEPDLEQRVSFRYDISRHGSAALTLDKLRENDEGLYRCRVDFKTSPTHNNKVRLNIIGKSLKCSSNNFSNVGNLYFSYTCEISITH